MKRTLAERFFSKVERVTESGCHIWTASTFCSGYGQFYPQKGKKRLAHRVAYELAFGPIPEGMFVCHTCDVPVCVNPSHFFLGSALENNRDRDEKGRHAADKQTHCKNGHRFDELNSYVQARTNYRVCKTCKNDSQKRIRSAKRIGATFDVNQRHAQLRTDRNAISAR